MVSISHWQARYVTISLGLPTKGYLNTDLGPRLCGPPPWCWAPLMCISSHGDVLAQYDEESRT